jgi:hypothetical protein
MAISLCIHALDPQHDRVRCGRVGGGMHKDGTPLPLNPSYGTCSLTCVHFVLDEEATAALAAPKPPEALPKPKPPSNWGRRIWNSLWTEPNPTRQILEAAVDRIPGETCKCRNNALAFIAQHPPTFDAGWHHWLWQFHNHASLNAGRKRLTWEQAQRRWAIGIEHPSMAIVVGNWFGDGMRPVARASIQAAAQRWGATYFELTEAIVNAKDKRAYVEKLRVDEHVNRAAHFDRVLYLDRDVVVRSDCPSLFGMVSIRSFGVVGSHQPGHEHPRLIGDHLAKVFSHQSEPFDMRRDHFNGGLYLFSPVVHGEIFAHARRLARIELDRHWTIFEEGLVSLAARRSGLHITMLDKTYLRCGGPARHQWQPNMTEFIWHFCGDWKTRDSRIDRTIWQV